MQGRIVIACYQPKAGKESELHALVQEHVPTLRAQNLVTDRTPIIMTAKSGTYIEVFEWASEDAIRVAHEDPVVQVMWQKFAEVCDYVPISSCEEAAGPFSEFTPINDG